jgi:hypothetical protein
MAESVKLRRNLPACPVCGARMELLNRQGDYVAAGCSECKVSITVKTSVWDAAKAERDRNRPPAS